jgi:putative membrane protein
LVVAADLVIDPAAVHAGFWVWDSPGLYYAIPLSNFIGWALTGAAYSWIFFQLSWEKSPFPCPPLTVAASLLLITSLWSGYLLRELLVIPAAIGIAIALIVGRLILSQRIPVAE